jgi:hypothetical protein
LLDVKNLIWYRKNFKYWIRFYGIIYRCRGCNKKVVLGRGNVSINHKLKKEGIYENDKA